MSNEYPCYQDGQDCIWRAPGCQVGCEEYLKAKAKQDADRAARAPSAALQYSGDKARAMAGRYERRKR